MKKVNLADVPEVTWSSPKGTFTGAAAEISEALGRNPASTDLNDRHPFDIEIARLAPGTTPCPFHSHSAQWEYYHVIAGTGRVRDADGMTAIVPGDAFLFKPGQPHQLFNDGTTDLVLLVVADNPIGESCHYPDSNKWAVESPRNAYLRLEALDYYDGEE